MGEVDRCGRLRVPLCGPVAALRAELAAERDQAESGRVEGLVEDLRRPRLADGGQVDRRFQN
jgi:hypothetical protein